jgi:hypothetical protein
MKLKYRSSFKSNRKVSIRKGTHVTDSHQAANLASTAPLSVTPWGKAAANEFQNSFPGVDCLGVLLHLYRDAYHRYGTKEGNDKDDDDDDDEDEEEDEAEDGAMFINSTDVLASLDFQSAHSGFVSLKIDDQSGNNSDSSEDSEGEEGSMVCLCFCHDFCFFLV